MKDKLNDSLMGIEYDQGNVQDLLDLVEKVQ